MVNTHTRNIKFRLVVPRGKHDDGTATALWTTHAEVNHAARLYMQMLLAMRQDEYQLAGGDLISKDACVEHAKELLKNAWDHNGIPESDRDQDRALEVLRALFDALIDGAANVGESAASPFFDAGSDAYRSDAARLRLKRNWVGDLSPEGRKAAEEWREAGGHVELVINTVSKGSGTPEWYRNAVKGDPIWVEQIEAWFKAIETKATKGLSPAIVELYDLKVLPFRDAYFPPRLGSKTAVVPWDRMCLGLALGDLKSWSSNNINTIQAHAQRQANLAEARAHFEDEEAKKAFEAFEGFISDRQAFLKQNSPGLGEGDYTYRITARGIRGWRDLRADWQKSSTKTKAALMKISAEHQTKKRGKFGDSVLFAWLAEPSNHWIWDQPGRDLIAGFADISGFEALVERSKPRADLTLPDPKASPRYGQLDPPGGLGKRRWQLLNDGEGQLFVQLDLIRPSSGASPLEEVRQHAIALAPTKQVMDVQIKPRAKAVDIDYLTVSGPATAHLKSADLFIDRSYVSRQSDAELAAGNIGRAYLSVALDVHEQLHPLIDAVPQRFETHFATSLKKASKNPERVKPGIRVLSVDLGLRHLASCSVFQLTDKKPISDTLAFEVQDLGYWAVHERSFSLKLPDERIDRRTQVWQASQDAELRSLRQALGRYKRLRMVGLEEPGDRRDYLEDLQDGARHGLDFELSLVQRLLSHVSGPEPVWERELKETLSAWRQAYGPIISKWRRTNRSRATAKHMGKTLWAIEHLDDTRRLLKSWSLLGQSSSDIRRWDNETRGVFGEHLLQHLDGARDDRLKTGADLIVQAARGYVRDPEGRWQQRHDPCHLVLFEDLSRYRTRRDRPPRENRTLMQWAHRGFMNTTKEQAELYRIATAEVDPAYTSRFRAKDGAPGHRLTPLTKAILDDETRMEFIIRDNPDIDPHRLQPGMLVLESGGSMLGTIEAGKLVTVQADINAAQNLHKRFWTRYGHQQLIRACKKTTLADGTVHWVPKRMGVRIQGTMGGLGYLTETGDDSGSAKWQSATPAEYRKLGGQSGEDQAISSSGDEMQEQLDAAAAQLLEALEGATSSSEITNFFRDESGEIFRADHWYPAKVFWGVVKAKIAAALQSQWS